MKKYTIIWVDSWLQGSHRVSLTKLQRVTASTIANLANSSYGQSAAFIINGWPTLEGETAENQLNFPVVDLG